jgi:hypothetical protein
MPTTSDRLELAKPVTSDDFDTSEIADNWQKVDDHPGIFVCTSGTRPTWSGSQEGQLISETDTGLLWRWNGTTWVRQHGTGWLGGGQLTTNYNRSGGAGYGTICSAGPSR